MVIKRTIACCIALMLLGAGAEAKERPRPKLEPSREATGCEYLGEGYTKAPGSDTCVKVSGSVRAEGAASSSR